MPKNKKDPCKLNACKIQACLKENNFQESACLDVLEEMRLCCLKWRSESFVCGGINLERSYLSPEKHSEQSDQKQKKK